MPTNSKIAGDKPALRRKPQSLLLDFLDWFNSRRVRFWSKLPTAVPQRSTRILVQVGVFLAAFLIIFSRRPDAILNAQFFAEDGQRWYADAYQFGLRCLFIPDELGGYLHTLPRLAALLALLVPLSLAPLVMNLCAIAFQILPVNIFLSTRFSSIPSAQRLLVSFLYLALPNTYEVNANATTIQWHLALLAFLVLVARPASGWKWQLFDGIVLVLITLESPVGVLLVPVAAVLWWTRRNHGSGISLAVLVPGAMVQTFVVLFSHLRRMAPNGANLHRLVSILGGQIFLAPLVGNITVLHMAFRHFPSYVFEREMVALVIGLAVLAYAIRCAPTELRLFILFAFAVLSLSLAHPIPGILPQPQWELLSFPGHGNRYYFLPSIAFLAALIWIAIGGSRVPRWVAGLLLLLLPLGIVRDWRYIPFVDLHFHEYASRFEASPPGTKMAIPLNPVNAARWTMELTKH
jgi:hypothetical protein